MIYTIKNSKLTVKIDDLGAELSSILGLDGTEYLWQGDPTYWKGRAYNLFPIVGRLPNGKYLYEGEVYHMLHHGFVRNSVLQAISLSQSEVEFVLRENEQTSKEYPFKFEYRIKYSLDENRLNIDVQVINTGEKDLIFAVGGHPGFNVPIGGAGKFEDYYLEFDAKARPKKISLSPLGLTTDKVENFALEQGNRLFLRHDLFDNDAICLKDMGQAVTIKSDNARRAIKVTYPQMRYLGVWHAPQKPAPYICIEPWSSMPSMDGVTEDLTTKLDMEKLPPEGKYSNIYSIEIIE
ncbi:MAG: aldose 1-epimerase family protein [Clostridia bacterium]